MKKKSKKAAVKVMYKKGPKKIVKKVKDTDKDGY